MPSKPFGDHLKREREMRGVSLEEIAAATRIAPRFLAALESEQWELLPGGVFNRGFIRSVARYLGLDEDSLVAEYALETRGRPEPGVVADPPEEPDRNWARVFVVIILVLLVAGGGWAAVHYLGPKIAARLHKHSGEPMNALPEAGVAAGFAATAGAQAATPDPAPAGPPAGVVLAAPATPAAGTDSSGSGTVTQLDLKLEAAKPVDIKVLSDRKPVFEGHMDARQVYRFTGRESLEISSSESSAIVLELNGQPVPAGGQPGQPGTVTLTQKDLKTVGAESH